MTDNQKKLLTAALGETVAPYWWCEKCQQELIPERVTWHETCVSCGYPVVTRGGLRTFTTAQDWEDLREKVVVPNISACEDYIHYSISTKGDLTDLEHWLTLSIEERCLLVHDFLIYMYEQGAEGFEWVKEFVGKGDA